VHAELLLRLNDEIQAIESRRGRSHAPCDITTDRNAAWLDASGGDTTTLHRHADATGIAIDTGDGAGIGTDRTAGAGTGIAIDTGDGATSSHHTVDHDGMMHDVATRAGCVHEWFGVDHADHADHETGDVSAGSAPSIAEWRPPLCILTDLARRAVCAHDRHRNDHTMREAPTTMVVWIGHVCRPYADMLAPSPAPITFGAGRIGRWPDLRSRSIFVIPKTDAERLWAIDVALRSSVVAAVIADGRGFGLAETRRLQLTAEGSRARLWLVRPPGERRVLSAAGLRWLVRVRPTARDRPRWRITLDRVKAHADLRHLTRLRPHWTVEWNHVTRTVTAPAPLVAGSHTTSTPRIGRRSA